MKPNAKDDGGRPTLFWWRLAIAGAMPVLVYFTPAITELLQTPGTGSGFQAAGCPLPNTSAEPSPDNPNGVLKELLAAIVICVPVWAAMLFANYRHAPKRSVWLILFAVIYALWYFSIWYLGSGIENKFHDNCQREDQQVRNITASFFLGLGILTLISAIFTTVLFAIGVFLRRVRARIHSQ